MKKIIFSLVLLFGLGQIIVAQDLNKVMKELKGTEKAIYQKVDKETILRNDPSSNGKLQEMEAVYTGIDDRASMEKYKKAILKFKNNNDYGIAFDLKEEDTNVFVVNNKKAKGKLDEVFIIVMEEDDLILMKLSGDFSDVDLVALANNQIQGIVNSTGKTKAYKFYKINKVYKAYKVNKFYKINKAYKVSKNQ